MCNMFYRPDKLRLSLWIYAKIIQFYALHIMNKTTFLLSFALHTSRLSKEQKMNELDVCGSFRNLHQVLCILLHRRYAAKITSRQNVSTTINPEKIY